MVFFFLLFAVVGLASAVMVVTRKNVMHAALFLLLTFACVGATYVMLRAEVLAAVQVLVYAGAVMVLFLFAILLVNMPEAMRLQQWTRQSAAAVILAGFDGPVADHRHRPYLQRRRGASRGRHATPWHAACHRPGAVFRLRPAF